MNEDKLKIIILYKNFYNDIYETLMNCDKKHLELKRIVLNECNLYLKDLYLANDLQDISIRLKKKEELVIRIKHLSSLLNHLERYHMISHKKYLKLGSDLEVILRLMNHWKRL